MFEELKEVRQEFREEGREQQDLRPGVRSGEHCCRIPKECMPIYMILERKHGAEDFLSQRTDRFEFRKVYFECRLQNP